MARSAAAAAGPAVFEATPEMGLGGVVAEAARRGFSASDSRWCNFGQGQPETGGLAGAPERLERIEIRPEDYAYGPLGGTEACRSLVAERYNAFYRRGRGSRYTAENVTLAPGGRGVLSRLLAAMHHGTLGVQSPDYASYAGLMALHAPRLEFVRVGTPWREPFGVRAADLARAAAVRPLDALLFSNPCNPTARLLRDEGMAALCHAAAGAGTALLVDEFYSEYVYDAEGGAADGAVSAAAHVDDVDRDPVVLVDGLTKNARYPGFRLGWAVGPKAIIDRMNRVAAVLDGGPSTLVQRAAEALLAPEVVEAEGRALRPVFAEKRAFLLEALEGLGIRCHRPESAGSIYLWGDVSGLPAPLADSRRLFQRALDVGVVVAPGDCFDLTVPPSGEPDARSARWVRFSFGPPRSVLEGGVERLTGLIARGGSEGPR